MVPELTPDRLFEIKILLLVAGGLIGAIAAAILLWRRPKMDPPPSPDEYWKDVEADERARRGIQD